MFLFLADLEIKRARRYQNFISFIVVRVMADSGRPEGARIGYKVVADLLRREMRETDILGALSENRLVILLPYADRSAGDFAKSRLESSLKPYDLGKNGCDVKIRQICFPRDGTGTADIIGKVLGEASFSTT